MTDQFAPRHDERGQFERVCQHCGTSFRTDNPQARYDSLECRKAEQNKRHYERHRDKVIQRVVARGKQNRRAAVRQPAEQRRVEFDQDVQLIQETFNFKSPQGAIRYAVKKLAKSIRERNQ